MNAPAKPRQQAAEPEDRLHNPDVERAVVAYLLDQRCPEAWPTLVAAGGSARSFYGLDHQWVAWCCERVAARGQALDLLAVATEAQGIPFEAAMRWLTGQERGHLPPTPGLDYADSLCAAIGGMATLGDMAAAFAPRGGDAVVKNCAHLVAYHRLRQAVAVVDQAAGRLRSVQGREEGPRVLGDLVAGLGRIYAAPTAGGDLAEGVDAVLAVHDAAQRGDVRATTCAAWGLRPLDLLVPLRAEGLFTLSGDTGTGKTSLALHAVQATAEAYGAGSVAIVSREMSAAQLGGKVLARELEVPSSYLDGGQLTASQRREADLVRARIASWGVQVMDAAQSVTVHDVVQYARTRKSLDPRLRLLVVDHLHLLSSTRRGQEERDRISEATGQLKALARAQGIAVLLLAQLNREGVKERRRTDGSLHARPEPSLHDLRGSKTIEDDSDAVLFLWAPHQAERGELLPVTIKGGKNRFGPPDFKIATLFDGARGQRFLTCTAQPDLVDHREVAAEPRASVATFAGEPTDAEDLFHGAAP